MEGKGGRESREDERKREKERVVPQNKFLATSLRCGKKGHLTLLFQKLILNSRMTYGGYEWLLRCYFIAYLCSKMSLIN